MNASIVGKAWLSVSRIPSPPGTLDNKIHHNNLIQNILPRIQANKAGAADAIMLDVEGYVAETNATNLFLVRRRDGGMAIGEYSTSPDGVMIKMKDASGADGSLTPSSS